MNEMNGVERQYSIQGNKKVTIAEGERNKKRKKGKNPISVSYNFIF